MTGWEVTPRAWEIDKINDAYNPTWAKYADQVLPKLVNELGINRVRLEIKSGWENPVDYWAQFVAGSMTYNEWWSRLYEKINDNSDPANTKAPGFQFSEFDFYVETVVLPMKKLVEANGEKLFINVCFVDFNTGNQGTLEHALAPAEYAEIIQVFLDRLRDNYAVKPDALEIVLEPDHTSNWRGTQIGQAAVAVSKRLIAAGYDLQIIGPSNSLPATVVTYFNDMIKVAGAADHLTALSYHRYGTADFAAIYAAARAGGVRTEMLEHTTGDVDELIEDLTVANASAWQKYGLAQRKAAISGTVVNYYYEVDLTDPAALKIKMSSATSLIAQFFKFVRMGAKRIAASTPDSTWTPLAFINTDGTYVVVIKTAQGTPSADAVIMGLPAGPYSVRTTDFSSNAMALPDVSTATDGSLTVSVPAGVTTIYGEAQNAGSGGAASGGTGVGGTIGDGGISSSAGAGGSNGGPSADAGPNGPGTVGTKGGGKTRNSGSVDASADGGNLPAQKSTAGGCGCVVAQPARHGTTLVSMALAFSFSGLARRARRRSSRRYENATRSLPSN